MEPPSHLKLVLQSVNNTGNSSLYFRREDITDQGLQNVGAGLRELTNLRSFRLDLEW